MQIIQRGNPSIMKSIASKSKAVSEANGLAQNVIPTSQVSMPTLEGGAFMSMQRRKQEELNKGKPIIKPSTPKYIDSKGMPLTNAVPASQSVTEKRLMDRLLESVETLSATGEYFNATNSLLTLYVMGNLTEGIMSSLSKEDLNEIKGIVREFKSVLDRY